MTSVTFTLDRGRMVMLPDGLSEEQQRTCRVAVEVVPGEWARLTEAGVVVEGLVDCVEAVSFVMGEVEAR